MSQTETKPEDRRAPTTYLIHELMSQRWSPRAFSTRPVEEEKLQRIFEAARWAASSANVQPWRFLIARHGEASFDKLHGCLADGNKPWTEQVPRLAPQPYRHDCFRLKVTNPPAKTLLPKHDLGLAFANLSLQATELGAPASDGGV